MQHLKDSLSIDKHNRQSQLRHYFIIIIETRDKTLQV